MNDYLKYEIATEVAWQVGDVLRDKPRAESRWNICNIVEQIIADEVIDENSEDIDEIISAWLCERLEVA